MRIITTLAMVREGDRVLLGMKKRGFGEGRWNGFGGKVKEGESIEEAMVRELKEESGLNASAYESAGVLEFFFPNGLEIEVHVFSVHSCEGRVCETEEMAPRWFSLSEIPFDSMWPDDQYWFPLFLNSKIFSGKFWFDEQANIVSHELFELNT